MGSKRILPKLSVVYGSLFSTKQALFYNKSSNLIYKTILKIMCHVLFLLTNEINSVRNAKVNVSCTLYLINIANSLTVWY